MPSVIFSENVDVEQIYKGSLFFASASDSSRKLCTFAQSIVEDVFGSRINEISTDLLTDVNSFVSKATKCKSTFTNDKSAHNLLKYLILDRYKLTNNDRLLFDVPRLRVVPNSDFLSTGISYNYKPHRDTWYGGGQDQINHWMSLANVSENSTFYIAPFFFSRIVSNNSDIFDLDVWNSKWRKEAASNVSVENRPHPIPLEELDMQDRFNVVLPSGAEVIFSGQHLHGSALNTTQLVRFSIDYRVCINQSKYVPPLNVDSRASGDYKKYMLPLN